MSEYVVIYEQAEDGGRGAYIPDLPGVVALGATRAEVGERIKEALTAARELLEAEWPSARTVLIDHVQLATVRGLAEEADKLMNALDLIVVDWRWLSRRL